MASIALTIALVGGPLVIAAYREGPVPGVTGGFGEPTCQKCHFDNSLNDPGGALRVDGVPTAYVPGREYRLTISVRRAGLKRAGFEMSARVAPDAGPARAGRQAGRFRALDGRVQIITAPDKTVEYSQHTKVGSQPAAPGRQRWSMVWVAPIGDPATVEFDIAANAANDDASPLGDFIYTSTVRSRPRR
jgi:hypothetical protein